MTGKVVGKASFDVAQAIPGVAGRLWIGWSDRGLRQVSWHGIGASAPAGLEAALMNKLPAEFEPLRAYFEGDAVELTALPIDPVGTDFQLQVWNRLMRVPRGEVRTYGEIARDIGSPRAMRAVGSANGRNPLIVVVPCHRIVAAGCQLGGYTGGLARKRYLLELEDVAVVGDKVAVGQTTLLQGYP